MISKLYSSYKRLIICSIAVFCCPTISQADTREEILTMIAQNEKQYNIPSGLLLAIAKIESNLEPFALNIGGRSVFFKDRDSALLAINNAIASNIRNIDVGVAQVNIKWHQSNFKTLDAMLSPKENINYAARLLAELREKHGDWHKALRHYHSANPLHHRKYSRKVLMCWIQG